MKLLLVAALAVLPASVLLAEKSVTELNAEYSRSKREAAAKELAQDLDRDSRERIATTWAYGIGVAGFCIGAGLAVGLAVGLRRRAMSN